MKPLEGKVIITTQPADQGQPLIRLLQEKGAVVYHLPMIETKTIKLPPGHMEELLQPDLFQLIVFTSKKGVKGFFENLHNLQNNYLLPSQLSIAVVGQGTADCLKHYGHKATFINPGKDAEDLAHFLLYKVINPQDNILLALGNRAPDFLEKTLNRKVFVKRINVYETILLQEADEEIAGLILQGKTDMCIFTSPSGVYAFKKLFGAISELPAAAIGHTTAKAMEDSGYKGSVTAPRPSPEDLANAVEKHFSGKT